MSSNTILSVLHIGIKLKALLFLKDTLNSEGFALSHCMRGESSALELKPTTDTSVLYYYQN